ncbi:tetratricopeptide repeat protein [Streptomyces sp. JNUCC 64]
MPDRIGTDTAFGARGFGLLSWSGEDIRDTGRALSAFLLHDDVPDDSPGHVDVPDGVPDREPDHDPDDGPGLPDGPDEPDLDEPDGPDAPDGPDEPDGPGGPGTAGDASAPDDPRFPPGALSALAVPAVLALRRRALRAGGAPAAPPPGGDPYGDGGLVTRLVRAARSAAAPDGPALAALLRRAALLWTGATDGEDPAPQPLTTADGFDGLLAPVAAAAFQPGPDPDAPYTDDGTPVLVALARAALDHTGPRFAHRVAAAVRDWGLTDGELRPHLAPLDELRAWAAGLTDGADPSDAGALAPLRDAVDDALDDGDVPRAEAAAERLAEEHRRLTVVRRLRNAERALGADGPGGLDRDGIPGGAPDGDGGRGGTEGASGTGGVSGDGTAGGASGAGRADGTSTASGAEGARGTGRTGGTSGDGPTGSGPEGNGPDGNGLLRLHVRTAAMYAAGGDLHTAERYLDVVEQALTPQPAPAPYPTASVPEPAPAPDATPSAPDSAPAPDDRTGPTAEPAPATSGYAPGHVHATAPEGAGERPAPATEPATALAPAHPALADPAPVPPGTLTPRDPVLVAAALLDRTSPGSGDTLRATIGDAHRWRLWQELAEELRGRGDDPGADAVFALGHPPVPAATTSEAPSDPSASSDLSAPPDPDSDSDPDPSPPSPPSPPSDPSASSDPSVPPGPDPDPDPSDPSASSAPSDPSTPDPSPPTPPTPPTPPSAPPPPVTPPPPVPAPVPYEELVLVPLLEDPPADAVGDGSPEAAAAHFARAVDEGSPVALGRAVGWYVRAGDPGAGLELYRRHAHAQYYRAAAVWNVACAYAAVGDDPAALESLRVFARILPGTADPAQRAALDVYCARHGEPSPLPRAAAPGPPSGAEGAADGSATPVDEPALAARAKELHDGGNTDDAVRLLDELLTANPSAPAAYLLMRVHRERGDLAAARATVERIAAARGELSWRHHVELARVALDRRCTDLDVARAELARARAKGAGPHWTQPLEERLERASGLSPAALTAPPPGRGGPGAPTGPGTGGYGTAGYGSGYGTGYSSGYGTGGRTTDHGRPGVARALLDGRLPELLDEARSGAPRPGHDLTTVIAHLRGMRLSVPPPGTLNLVIKAVMDARDDYAARDLATWLMDNRYWDEAVEVLQSCVLWISPERLPRVLHLRDRAARAGGILEELNPACPPVREDTGTAVRADRHEIQPHLVRIVEPEASLVGIWRAQHPPVTAGQGDLVDLWIDAVRAHPVALGNALGQMVIAGRPEDALRLHSAYADDMWLTAGAAWNLGCAYAATGRLRAAADTFGYHARVSSRPFTAQQLRELTPLFEVVGRPVPRPALRPATAPRRIPAHTAAPVAAPHPPRAAPLITEAESTAARLVAQCRNEPSTHHFRLAADAVRKAVRLDRAGQDRHAATVRELFTLQTPDPATVAALVMVLETAQLTAEAWELLARWIDDSAAHPELLGPAVRIAHKVGRVRELRDTLLRHLRPESGFELYLTLAKASHELQDTDGRARYAQQTLARNPSCAEAAYLLDPQGRQAKKAVQAAPGPVWIDASTPRARAVALLATAYGSTIDFLDQYALTRYRPAPHRTALRTALREGKKARLAERVAPPELLADAEEMLAAAEAEDWEAAATHARALVSGRPWHVGIANAAAMCLIRLHELPGLSAAEQEEVDDEIRGLSDMAGTPQVRLEILVQLAHARARYDEADALLTAAPRWWRGEADVWAQAGLRAGAETCDRPAAAAELLLEYGRLRPGPPGMRAAAVAAVLADRGGRPELTDRAITAYRLAGERTPTPERLVDEALAVDYPEVLNTSGAPVLAPAQIDRIAAHLAAEPVRLLSFLRRTSHHSGNSRTPEQRRELVARRLHLFDVYADADRVGAALVRLWEALDYGAGIAEVTAPLERLCARHGHPDPAGAARALLARKGETGTQPPPPRAVVALAEEIATAPPDAGLPDRVARFMAELAAGVDPLAGAVVARLATGWDRQARLILATAHPGGTRANATGPDANGSGPAALGATAPGANGLGATGPTASDTTDARRAPDPRGTTDVQDPSNRPSTPNTTDTPRTAGPTDTPDAPDAPAGPVTGLIAETAAALAESDPLAEDLLLRRSPYGECVSAVQRALRAHWQRTAKQRLRQGAPVLAELRATRIGDGPVEAVFELRTGQQPPLAAAVTASGEGGAAYGWEGDDLSAEDSQRGSLVIAGAAAPATGDPVALTLRWRFPDQEWSGPVRYEVPVESLARRDAVRRRFTPRARTGKEMFVGRQREKAQIRRTFAYATEAPVSPQLITGSRRAGKTSLIEDLRRLHNPTTGSLLPPADWPVPRLFPLLVSGQSAAHPVRDILPSIADDAKLQLGRFYPEREPATARWDGSPALVTAFADWWERVRRSVWPDEVVKPLVIIDECQELLRGYETAPEVKRQVMGVLRDLVQRGEIALLFSGSCTYAQLQTLLEGTLIGTDVSDPLPIGLLEALHAMQVVHQGFHDDRDGFAVEVLDRAAIAVYEATLGHPYHLHLIGETLAKLLEERGRRVVDPPLVKEAVRAVVGGEGAVTGLLDQYDAAEKIPPLLFEVADRLMDSRDEGDVKAGWSEAKCEELADYVDLGLLRREEGSTLAWVNPIVERWFDNGRVQGPEADPQTAPLEREGLQVTARSTRDDRPVWRVRDGSGRKYRATLLAEGDPRATVERFAPTTALPALPGRWRACGDWLLQQDVEGRTLDRYLNPDEPVPAEAAVRWIADVCDVLDEVHRRWGVPHGDIHPDHLALHDDGVRIAGWGHSGVPDPDRPGETPPTWDSVYYRPQCEPGAPRTAQHDTVALAALLHQLLDTERRLPWPSDGSTSGDRTAVLVDGPVGDILFNVLREPRTPRVTSPAALAAKLRATLPPDPAGPVPPERPGVTVINQTTATSQSTGGRVDQRHNEFGGPVGAVTGDGAQVDVERVGDRRRPGSAP